MPAAFKNVEITGANIRRKDRRDDGRMAGGAAEQGARHLHADGDLGAAVEPEERRAGGDGGGGGRGGAGDRRGGGQCAAADAGWSRRRRTPDLLKVDVRELPEWAAAGDEAATVLVYRYLRPGYRLALTAQRFEEAEVLQALVDSAG